MSKGSNPELIEFQEFIMTQIQSGDSPESPEECLTRYRALHPSDEELAESIVAIETALEQKAQGAGKSLETFAHDFRHRNSI
jgi:hypothetical protein